MSSVTPPLGPRAGWHGRPLSASATAILEMLRDQPEPLTTAALARATGLHGNTVREHLDVLVRRGLVARRPAPSSGRGRPAWLYERTGREPQESAAPEYAGLAAALAAAISRTSESPAETAAAAGEEWGHELARDRGASSGSPAAPEAARRQVLELLDDLGFEPEPDPGQPANVRLTRCPLLEAAHRHPEVVCAVHVGIVRGALEEYGADPTGTTLEPFVEPGACRLVVPPTG
jgi:predicted ArsR family transcriptional regulator